MKTHKKILLLPLILALLTISSFAETKNSDISFLPTTLSINATQGESIARNLFVTTSKETTISGIKLISIDLSSENNKNVLTQDNIIVTENTPELSLHSPVTLPIKININDVSSGHYEGNIRLQYDTGYENIPIDLKVKDDYYLALFVLLLGVSIAFGLTYYRKYGKSRDELFVQIYSLTQQMKEKKFYDNTDSLALAFQTKIKNFLIDTEEAINDNNWNSAREALASAKVIWVKWIKGVRIWTQLQALIDAQYESIETLSPEGTSLYLNSITNKIEASIKNCPNDNTTDILRNILHEMSVKVHKYQVLQEHANNHPELLETLDLLTIDNVDELKELEKEINDIRKTKKGPAVINQYSKEADAILFDDTSSRTTVPHFNVNSIDFDKMERAGNNLLILKLITIALAIITIAGTGFNEFYLKNLIFGANIWSDYFNLFIWGFGSEATRNILVGSIKETDALPKVKEES